MQLYIWFYILLVMLYVHMVFDLYFCIVFCRLCRLLRSVKRTFFCVTPAKQNTQNNAYLNVVVYLNKCIKHGRLVYCKLARLKYFLLVIYLRDIYIAWGAPSLRGPRLQPILAYTILGMFFMRRGWKYQRGNQNP